MRIRQKLLIWLVLCQCLIHLVGCDTLKHDNYAKLNSSQIPQIPKEKKLEVIEITRNSNNANVYFLLKKDSLILKGINETLWIDNSKFMTDSVAYSMEVLNWYSNFSIRDEITKFDESVTNDFFYDLIINDSSFISTGTCMDCLSLYHRRYKKNIFW